MKLKVGDRVKEKGQLGTVVAFHTAGTVDVKFDGERIVKRRQMRQVHKANPRKKTTRLLQRLNNNKPILILGCGKSKQKEAHVMARDLYLRGLWQIYRKSVSQIPHPRLDVYVMSAKYGILHETEMICDYNMVLVTKKRDLSPNEVYYEDVVPLLKEQIRSYKWGNRPVITVLGKPYQSALQKAGVDFISADKHPQFPSRHVRGGTGKHNKALKWFLSQYKANSRRSNGKLQLYKTGEVTQMGEEVYRRVGKRRSKSEIKGVLTGEYFVSEGFHENVYKDKEGYWRSERGGILSSQDQYRLDRGMPTGRMYAVGSPYKEGKGHRGIWRDGEPSYEVTDFEIVNLNPEPERAQFEAQVQGIYESQVRDALGLPYNHPFIGPRGGRLDSRLSKKKRREALSAAFAIATGFGRKHGYLVETPDPDIPFPVIPTQKGLDRSAQRLADKSDYLQDMNEYETSLAMSRKKKNPKRSQHQRAVESDLKRIEKAYPKVRLTIYIEPQYKAFELSSIVVPKSLRKLGIGSEIMERLVEVADNYDYIIVLTPSKDYGATSISRLEKFYRRFGFVKNKGRQADYRFRSTMIRYPNRR